MLIGVLIDRAAIGGVARFAFEEVKWLRELGHEAELLVITKQKNRVFIPYDVPTKFLSEKFPRTFRYSFRFPFFHFFSSFHVTSPIFTPKELSEKYDVIISHGTYTCFTAHEVWRRRKIPYVAYIHDPISYILRRVYSKSGLRYAFSFLLPLGQRFDTMIVQDALTGVVQSKVHREFLSHISDRKIKVVYPGCYAEESIPKTRGNFILAAKSMWTIDKRPELLLEILRRIKNANLVIVGDWSPLAFEEFVNMAKRLGLRERVKITGQIDESELTRLYREARVLVHANFEAFGMTGLEAAAHGCPFMIPKGSGVTEVFTDGVHGFFPNEGDLDAYVEHLDRLMTDERLAWRMGYEAWKAAKEYTWERHTRELVKIVEAAE